MDKDIAKETCQDLEPLNDILATKNKVTTNDLIPILQQIQQSYGYLPPNVLSELSKRTGIPASRIFGVTTFYEQFYLEPHGRHTIRCCRGTACHVKNGYSVINAVKQQLNVEPGETTEDMKFTFETVACLGTCFLAPAMMVNNDYYGHLTKNKIKGILESYT